MENKFSLDYLDEAIKLDSSYRDAYFSNKIESKLKEFEKEYDIETDIFKDVLVPISDEELKMRERAKLANREIVRKGISIEDIERYVKVDGADINKENCRALVNAVEENDIEKVKLILELGGNPKLATGSNSAISRASSLEIIELLVEYGADMIDDMMMNVVEEPKALEFCLKAGLNPDSGNSLAIRRACRGSYVDKENIGESYLDSFKTLLKYGASLEQNGQNMLIRWAGEFNRTDLVEYAISLGKMKDVTKKELEDGLFWLDRTRRIADRYICQNEKSKS